MEDVTPQQAVAKYYSRLGSRLGYKLVMGRSQHFGYYDKTHTNEPAAQQKYHQEFAKLLTLKSGMKVLDAGCGQGVVACYLAQQHGVDVTGITVVPHEVSSAEQRAKKLGVQDHTTFILADYAKPPFKPATFDRIYTTETLSHAVDVQAVVEVFMRLLKPGGKLICAEYEFDYDKFGEDGRWAAEFVKRHAAIHGVYQFGPGQFMSKLRAAGFTQVKELDWTRHVAPSYKRLARLAKPIASIVRPLRLQRFFVNAAAADMYAKGAERDAFAYKVYVAAKKG